MFRVRDGLQGIDPGEWGTPDIDISKKPAAYKFDPILKNIYENAGYTVGQVLTPDQFSDFLRRASAFGRPEFQGFYGDAATVQRNVDQAYEKSWSVRVWKGIFQ